MEKEAKPRFSFAETTQEHIHRCVNQLKYGGEDVTQYNVTQYKNLPCQHRFKRAGVMLGAQNIRLTPAALMPIHKHELWCHTSH